MVLTKVWLLVALLFHTVTPVISEDTHCSPNRRSASMFMCLFNIRLGLSTNETFWFGTRYTSDCPSGADGVFCSNKRPGNADSISTRLFRNSLDLNQVTKYLKVHYSSAEGTFNACGNIFEREEWQSEIIPTSNDVFEPWYIRNMPNITWDARDGDYYTVLFYDVGQFVTHMAYVNIPGNNVIAGEVILSYQGPDIAFGRENPYAFFLYKQQGYVTIAQEWVEKMSNASESFSIQDFVSSYAMTGPVAVNWVVVTGDEYAAMLAEDAEKLYSCPLFVNKAKDSDYVQFIPDSARLSVIVDVNFTSEPLAFTVCCSSISLPRAEATLNPFNVSTYTAATVRGSPTVTFRKAGYFDMSTNFTGDIYTLIVITPTEQSLPVLHYMVINIPDGNIDEGDAVQSYEGPVPQDEMTHSCLFLLYKQPGSLNVTDALSYRNDTCGLDLLGRCPYDVISFNRDLNLNLVGANWMHSSADTYVKWLLVDILGSLVENDSCHGMPNFPCSTTTTDTSTLTTPNSTVATPTSPPTATDGDDTSSTRSVNSWLCLLIILVQWLLTPCLSR